MSIRSQFEEEIAQVKDEVYAMALRAEEDLAKAASALKRGDKNLAKEVKKDDEVINAYQLSIEEHCALLIVTQQPVAKDMRWVLTTIRIADELERIGDHAVHLAKAAIKLAKVPQQEAFESLGRMAEQGIQMIRGSIDAYMKLDKDKAYEIAAMDDAIDAEHKKLVSGLLKFLKKNPDKAAIGTKLIQTSGYLERLGDHVTNICEMVLYCAEGRRIELNR